MNIVIDNDIWCELEVEGSICKYKFFLLNIPCYIGGHKKTGDQLDNYWENNWRKVPPEVIEGVIICDWGTMLDDIVNKRVSVPGGTQQYFFGTFVISQNEKDGHHQNLLVGYLTAQMVYCAITGESAVGQPYGFADDRSLHPEFDMEAYQEKYYTYEPITNFVDIYRSESDMNGLQQLIDQYIIK